MSKTLTTSVAFTDAQNNVLAGGKIIFQLNMGAKLITSGQIVNVVTIPFTLTATGMMPAGALLDANDELQPTGTFYVVTIFNSNGLLVRGPENWILSGVSPIDISTITSSSIPDPGLASPVIQNPSAPQTITGQSLTLTSSAPLVTQGALTTTRFNAEIYAAGQAGATCGDKINAAIALLPANGGVVNVNAACGVGTASSPWAAVTIPANVAVRFVEPGTYWTNKITFTGSLSQLYSVFPCSPGLLNLACPVTIKQGNTLNLTSHINIAVNANQVAISDINFDGNKANNPTGGPELLVQGQSFYGTRFITQNSPSHGTMYSSTGIANQACCAINIDHFSATNNGDGLFCLNTADMRQEAPSYEGNGIIATVNTTSTTVTATAGSWSTDSSLVGTHFRVNNLLTGGSNVSLTCLVAAIPSTTTITLGQCISPAGVVTTMGTNTGWGLNWGCGDEYSNCPTVREVNHDHGGNMMDGHLAYATTGSVMTSNGHVIGMGQFGNNFQNDIFYISDATANGSANLTGGVFSGIQIQPTNANRTPTGVWANVAMIDGGGHIFDGFSFAGGTAPHQLAYGIQIAETAANRYSASAFSGLENLTNTSYSVLSGGIPTFISDTTAVGTSVQMGNLTFLTPNTGGSASAIRVLDTATGNSFYLRSNNGAAQWLNNSFGVPGVHTNMNLSGAVFSSSFTPSTAGGTDIGSAALPVGNFWLGTAATNNFKLQPAATAAARVISMPDPLGAVNMPYVIASGTTTLTANAALAAVTTQAANTTAATGALATDSIEWAFATAPTAGDNLCHVLAYVTAGNVNFSRTNPTAAAQNVSALVINWRVIR